MSTTPQGFCPETPNRLIWRLSWPQMLMMLANFFIGFVDVYVAGQINKDVQASLGMINTVLFFFLVVSMAVANGSVSAISQSIGAGLTLRAKRYVGLSLELGVVFGTLIFLIGMPAQGLFLKLLHVPQELSDITAYFMGVYLLILPAYYLYTIGNAIFRAYRQVMFPLYSTILVTLTNTWFTYGLGLGKLGMPEWGYKGVAWGTFFAVAAGCLFNITVFWRQGLLVRESFPPIRWSRKAFGYLYGVAWPAGLMQLLWNSGYLVLFAITASLPEGSIDALAGMTAGIRIESLLFMPGFAFNMTASILVGQYVGAGRPAEAKRYGYRILTTGVVSMSVLAACLWQFMGPAAAIIAPEPAVQAQAVDYLHFNLAGMPFTLTNMILSGAFIGAGASVYNLWAFAAAAWGIRLPLAYVLGHHVYGNAMGVWMAMLASMAIQAIFLLYLWHFGNWTRFSMRRKNSTPGARGSREDISCPKENTSR